MYDELDDKLDWIPKSDNVMCSNCGRMVPRTQASRVGDRYVCMMCLPLEH
jgi:formylmethanofuran dehydrogenase subunit E